MTSSPKRVLLIIVGFILAITYFLNIGPGSASVAILSNGFKTNDRIVSDASSRHAKIGKVSRLSGKNDPLYERAVAGQEVHNERFGYPMFVLREEMTSEYWSKPAYMLSLISAELAKPEEKRLKWLFWVDGDIVLMNPNIPLETFLPPEPEYSHIHLLVTNDRHGFNNGAFFIRVDEWSVLLLSAMVSLTTYQPDVRLKSGDQSAMQTVLNQPRFSESTLYVPQRWFNACAGSGGKDRNDPFSKSRKYSPGDVLEGDLQVHLTGPKSQRKEFMSAYLDASEMHTDRWELPMKKTTYREEVDKFWQNEAPKQRKGVVEKAPMNPRSRSSSSAKSVEEQRTSNKHRRA